MVQRGVVDSWSLSESLKKMARLWFVLAVLPLVVLAAWYINRSRRTHGPRIVHLIYLPWDKQQKLKADPSDFDHTYEQALREAVEPRGWTVMMWTQPKLTAEFGDLWSQALRASVRPTQIVDLMRWAVVAKWGGVYVQYDTVLHTSLERLLPRVGTSVRLFTERVLTPEQCRNAAIRYSIRQGVPEEPLRVMNQVFAAAEPNHPFIVRCRDTILHRMSTHKPREDYDFLYAGANAWISTLYDVYGRDDPSIEIVSERDTKRAFTVSSRGSWRMDAVKWWTEYVQYRH